MISEATMAPPPPPDLRLSPDEVSRLRLVLLRVARRLRQHAAGMTQSQLSALSSVERLGPLTISELAGIENVQPPSISRIVGALEGEGWIERVTDPRDGRIALVQATPRGRRELARLRADRDAWLARRVAALPPAEQRRITAVLPALEQLLESGEDPSSGPTGPQP
jgi:DNA-binding MarR family transcriptional regulator